MDVKLPLQITLTLSIAEAPQTETPPRLSIHPGTPSPLRASQRRLAVAKEWLHAFLAEGARPAQQVIERGLAEGFKRRDLYRASKDTVAKYPISNGEGTRGTSGWWWKLGRSPYEERRLTLPGEALGEDKAAEDTHIHHR